MFQHSKPIYELVEAFELLGMSRAHLYKEIKRGRLRTVKNGRRTLVPAGAIDEYVKLLEKESESRAA